MNALRDILWLIVIDANRDLLSDAKVFEYVSENFIGGDGASEDVGEMVYAKAEVFWD